MMEKGLKTHNPTDNTDNNSLKRSANQTLTRHRDSEGFRRQTPDTCLLRSGVRRSSGLGCRSTSYFRHPPPPPKYWFCFYWEKSAEAESPLMTTCFQESPSCYGGRTTAHQPPSCADSGPAPRKAAEGPPWCLTPALLSIPQCTCPGSSRISRAAVLLPAAPLLVPAAVTILSHWKGFLSCPVLFVLWNCCLFTSLLFLS